MIERAKLAVFGLERHASRINISELANNIGKFYSLPEEIVERGKNIKILVVNNQKSVEIFEEFREECINALREETVITTFETSLRKEYGAEFDDIKPNLKNASEEVLNTSAAFVIIQKRERLILVLKGESRHKMGIQNEVTHELIHSMGYKSFVRRGLLGFTRKGTMLPRLDEAATELLRISFQTAQKDISSIHFKKVDDGSTYLYPLLMLAAVMRATYLPGGKPLTIQDLANYYFGACGSDEEYINELLESLMDSIPNDEKDDASNILFNLCFPELSTALDKA